MSVAYRQAQLSKYRITKIAALDDFNPHQIDQVTKLRQRVKEAYVEPECVLLKYQEL